MWTIIDHWSIFLTYMISKGCYRQYIKSHKSQANSPKSKLLAKAKALSQHYILRQIVPFLCFGTAFLYSKSIVTRKWPFKIQNMSCTFRYIFLKKIKSGKLQSRPKCKSNCCDKKIVQRTIYAKNNIIYLSTYVGTRRNTYETYYISTFNK